MKHLLFSVLTIAVFPFTALQGQDLASPLIAGYHVGVVQPLLAYQHEEFRNISESSFYSIGFPLGITMHTSGRMLIDMEVVPFVKPYMETSKDYEVHVLLHPGVLVPLGGGFTFGMRLAFETGNGQFGFTPLLNKGFAISDRIDFFVELVAPGRFGPEKDSGYTQVLGLHLGFGFH